MEGILLSEFHWKAKLKDGLKRPFYPFLLHSPSHPISLLPLSSLYTWISYFSPKKHKILLCESSEGGRE